MAKILKFETRAAKAAREALPVQPGPGVEPELTPEQIAKDIVSTFTEEELDEMRKFYEELDED